MEDTIDDDIYDMLDDEDLIENVKEGGDKSVSYHKKDTTTDSHTSIKDNDIESKTLVEMKDENRGNGETQEDESLRIDTNHVKVISSNNSEEVTENMENLDIEIDEDMFCTAEEAIRKNEEWEIINKDYIAQQKVNAGKEKYTRKTREERTKINPANMSVVEGITKALNSKKVSSKISVEKIKKLIGEKSWTPRINQTLEMPSPGLRPINPSPYNKADKSPASISMPKLTLGMF